MNKKKSFFFACTNRDAWQNIKIKSNICFNTYFMMYVPYKVLGDT